MIKDRNTAIFYPAAVCNLNCRYCSIDKNPALVEIDKILAESFDGDYYLNFTKEIFPDPNQLHRVETWGGEPTLGWHRMYRLMHDLIRHYPNLCEFFSSSNMVQPKFLDELIGMLRVFGEFHPRKFKFVLQMSLDGTEEITDYNRGNGVTKRLRATFEKMVQDLAFIVPDNVDFECYFKATLNADCVRVLQTKESIVAYYRFFEGFYDAFYKLNKCSHAKIFPTPPNMATPAQHTVEEGKLFANMCRICKEIEKDSNHFKYFTEITPYNSNCANSVGSIACDGFTCGTCRSVIGFLPNDMISGCHAAFVDLISDYKKRITENSYGSKVLDPGVFTNNPNNFFCFHKDRLAEREAQVEHYYRQDTTARLVTLKVIIQALAYAGQIDDEFMEDEKALQAADLMYRNASNCMNDNLGATGSITTPSTSLIRLLLNGAYKYISVKE